ncbi:hypothetical protein GQ53DRAFT_242252 [Thozetella sp. PMI_491]|nr:hypothetical protein GQ53DRAFT_242252 [Thozetella sp. PMI_491]
MLSLEGNGDGILVCDRDSRRRIRWANSFSRPQPVVAPTNCDSYSPRWVPFHRRLFGGGGALSAATVLCRNCALPPVCSGAGESPGSCLSDTRFVAEPRFPAAHSPLASASTLASARNPYYLRLAYALVLRQSGHSCSQFPLSQPVALRCALAKKSLNLPYLPHRPSPIPQGGVGVGSRPRAPRGRKRPHPTCLNAR